MSSDILNIILGFTKDKVYEECVNNIRTAYLHLGEVEAQCRREKARGIINSIAKLDIAILKFETAYSKVMPIITEDAKNAINKYIKEIKLEREALVKEKKRLGK